MNFMKYLFYMYYIINYFNARLANKGPVFFNQISKSSVLEIILLVYKYYVSIKNHPSFCTESNAFLISMYHLISKNDFRQLQKWLQDQHLHYFYLVSIWKHKLIIHSTIQRHRVNDFKENYNVMISLLQWFILQFIVLKYISLL